MGKGSTPTYKLKFGFLFLWILLFFVANELSATHIRAGEITARRINNITLTYEITVTGYKDTDSQIEFGGDGSLDLGDGNVINGPFQTDIEDIGNGTLKVTFTVIHTYSRANASGYLVTYTEDFRNNNIFNINNGASDGTTFYVETLLIIDPFYGINNTPIMTVPPVDLAAIGELFIHNPGAFDPDGDSLAYRLTQVKSKRSTQVGSYKEVTDPAFYTNYDQGNESQNGPPNVSINAITGDLIWDAPGDITNQTGGDNCPEKAEYNIAFIVEEWRFIGAEWELMGYVERDMQIIVCSTDNERPEIEAPDPICVVAGDTINEIIIGSDPDGNPVKIEAYGGPFEVASPATYQPENLFQSSPGSMTFNWNTVCGHVRERPYEVQLKITDDPLLGPSLVEFATWEITVVGPAPTGLQSTPEPGRAMSLSWDSYTCSNADSMQIWRRVGEYDIMFDECQLGMPLNTGYELIARVPISELSYLDNNSGLGLSAGSQYCYRLVAEFPSAGDGRSESYVSEEACESLIIDVPLITNVDIVTTASENGSIDVRWTPPYQIDSMVHPPGYTYDVLRAEGMMDTDYDLVASNLSDTTFSDSGLNTVNQAYNYRIVLYDGNDILVDTSAMASSVMLDLDPLLNAIELNWTANVPWSLRDSENPYHYIYRDQVDTGNPDQLILIDSVEVSSSALRYLDNGAHNNVALDEQVEYCYYVTTYGTYNNDFVLSPLINRSQVACAQPNDTISPCKPPVITFSDDFDCESFLDAECGVNIYRNAISWEADQDPNCDMDIQFYNIWFTSTGLNDDLEIVGTSFTTEFVHEGLNSYKGCYLIQAVDRSGNTSELSEMICRDNCPVYKLPNAFTPNNDGINDTFTPLFNNQQLDIPGFINSNCPRFVESVVFKVFDRNGKELFSYDSRENENNILINWDGRTGAGLDVPAGVYYYSAEVNFDLLERNDSNRVFNGWVQVLR